MLRKKKVQYTPPEISYCSGLGQRLPDEFVAVFNDVLGWLISYAEGCPDQVWELTDGHGLDEKTRETIMGAVYARLDKLPESQNYHYDRSLI